MTISPTPNLDPGYELTLSVRDVETGVTVARMTRVVTYQVDALPTRERDDAKWTKTAKQNELYLKFAEMGRDLRNWAEREPSL